ncbi:hypothetical protein [Vibrio harveyi]|uniref:hypothetical protein n=1 Tax=Vibrio harveyi TaxID=669 RepID=UPI0018F19F4B|nr:hypothetical protein [Vibrio harveyi]
MKTKFVLSLIASALLMGCGGSDGGSSGGGYEPPTTPDVTPPPVTPPPTVDPDPELPEPDYDEDYYILSSMYGLTMEQTEKLFSNSNINYTIEDDLAESSISVCDGYCVKFLPLQSAVKAGITNSTTKSDNIKILNDGHSIRFSGRSLRGNSVLTVTESGNQLKVNVSGTYIYYSDDVDMLMGSITYKYQEKVYPSRDYPYIRPVSITLDLVGKLPTPEQMILKDILFNYAN